MQGTVHYDFTGWLTPAQAGQFLGVSNERIRQMVALGRLESMPTPLGKLISKSSLLQEQAIRESGGRRVGRPRNTPKHEEVPS